MWGGWCLHEAVGVRPPRNNATHVADSVGADPVLSGLLLFVQSSSAHSDSPAGFEHLDGGYGTARERPVRASSLMQGPDAGASAPEPVSPGEPLKTEITRYVLNGERPGGEFTRRCLCPKHSPRAISGRGRLLKAGYSRMFPGRSPRDSVPNPKTQGRIPASR